MTDETSLTRTLEASRHAAHQALARREEALRRRSAGFRSRAGGAQPPLAEFAAPAAKMAEAGGVASSGVLVAEGDSWFDYPGCDVLGALEDDHGFDIESVAHTGDRVEDMAYSGGQLDDFCRRLERVLRRGVIPRAVLLSGGGNDIAGDELAVLLNHAASAKPGINEDVARGVIDERLRLAYTWIFGAVTSLCQEKLGARIPILVHGYDYPVADGRGFWGGRWFLPGPWLEPRFRQKGFGDPAERARLLQQLIDRFNQMLIDLAALPGFSHVRFVDLRGTLSTGADYRDWWANELHPTEPGFRRVAERFAALI